MNDIEADNRIRILILSRILYDRTDEAHGLSTEELLSALAEQGFHLERKTLYKDIECLNKLGHDILKMRQGKKVLYHVGNRLFETAELRILIDAVNASHFLTPSKTRQLIRKLESISSRYEARDMDKNVIIAGQRKSDNKTIYYLVNDLHFAIRDDRQVRFQYTQWNTQKCLVKKYDGAIYHVSPWTMLFDHENYYLIGYDNKNSEIRHYRVDKIVNLEVVEEHRLGEESYKNYNIDSFMNGTFGMFAGSPVNVVIRVCEDKVGIMIDRFGKDIQLKQNKDDTYDFEVYVRMSDQFLGWIVALGEGVEIIGPESVRKKMQEIGALLLQKYK